MFLYLSTVVTVALTVQTATSFVPPHHQCASLTTRESPNINFNPQNRWIGKSSPRTSTLIFYYNGLDDNDRGRNNATTDIYNLEKEVLASTQANLDVKRVTDVLFEDNNSGNSSLKSKSEQHYTEMMIALAAAIVIALATDLFSHSLIISAIVFVVAFMVASGDPLDEEGVAGSLTRIVGRTTLKSVDAAKPKIKAVARAAVFGEEELASLMGRLTELEQENSELRLWVQQRKDVDESFPLVQKFDNDGLEKDMTSGEMYDMEKEVLASTQARLDMKRVAELLLEKESKYSDQWGTLEPTTAPPSPVTIALAAAIVSAVATELFFHSWFISSVVFVVAFVVACGDPVDEEGVAGSIARIVGRTTLKSVDAAKPKIRAVARAAVIGEKELESLMTKLGYLEQENHELRSSVESYLRKDEVVESKDRYYNWWD